MFRDSKVGQVNGVNTSSIFTSMPIIFAICVNLIIYIFYNKKSMCNLIIFGALIILFALSLLHINMITPSLFLIFLFVLNLDLIPLSVFIRIDFTTRLISVFLILSLNYFQLLPGNSSSLSMNISHSGNAFRYALGFASPDELGMAFLSLFISGFVLSKLVTRKLYISLVIFLVIVYIYISKMSDSREFEIGGLIIILSMLFSKFKLWGVIFKYLSLPSVICSILLFIYITYIMNSSTPLYDIINTISSNRLMVQKKLIEFYPAKLIGYGNISSLTQTTELNVDNIYSSILLSCGIIGLFIYELLFISLPIISLKLRNNSISILIVILAICAFASGYSSDLLVVFLVSYSIYYKRLGDSHDIIKK